MNHSKVAIIGAGPAGIACAVQLKRFEITPFLFEKKQVGGLLRNANLVENYLGFESGISGLELVKNFRQNLENLNINPIMSEVKRVSFSENNFCLETDKGLFTAKILVVASGTRPKTPEILIPDNIENKIFFELADLGKNSYAGKKFVIIGAGDAAFDYAINLVNNYGVSDVMILNRSDKAKCLPLLENRAAKDKNISQIKNIRVDKLEKIDEEIVVSCSETNKGRDIKADYLIFATGRVPCQDFLDEMLINNSSELQNQGLLHFIGDVTNGSYRQTSIATGDGIKAAMKIYDYFSLN